MAERSKRSENDGVGGSNYRLISLDFSAKEGLELDDWLGLRGPDYIPDVIKILERGWKLSFSWSEKYGVYFFSLTGKDTGTIYDGYTVSLRHKDFNRVYSVLEYVVGVYLEDERLPIPAGRDRDNW